MPEQNKRVSGRKNKRSSEPVPVKNEKNAKPVSSEPIPEKNEKPEPMPEHIERSSEPVPVSLKLYIIYCFSSRHVSTFLSLVMHILLSASDGNR